MQRFIGGLIPDEIGFVDSLSGEPVQPRVSAFVQSG
jgi:hypothetical protein